MPKGNAGKPVLAFEPTGNDEEILLCIAEHRILSVSHAATLLGRNPAALRRRLAPLKDADLIHVFTRDFGNKRGHPEGLLALTPTGVNLLKARGRLEASVLRDRGTAEGISCIDHELVIADFRVQLIEMERLVPGLTTRFFSSKSLLLPRSPDGQPLVCEQIRPPDGLGQEAEFIPDGVVALTHQGLGKTLLFFLEVDMGTQPRVSSQSPERDIRQKIVNYQTYFLRQGYRRYEGVLNCTLRGFRLLILTIAPTRLAALCRLGREMPPSDFVWVTDRGSLMANGLWARIWVVGGRDTDPRQSILGSQMPSPPPAPASLKRPNPMA